MPDKNTKENIGGEGEGDSMNKALHSDDSFKQINDDLIPFACHVDSRTVLLKNGEILQTIAIYNYRNNSNLNGEFTSRVKTAVATISNKYGHSNVAFWIHNIRSRNVEIVRELMKGNQGGNIFQTTLEDEWRQMCLGLNNYDTVCYITVVIQCVKLKLSLKSIPLVLNKAVLSSKVRSYVESGLEKIKGIMAELREALKVYKLHTLRCYKDEERQIYLSEHLQFFSRLLNFDNSKYTVPIAGLSSVINRSLFNFDFGSFTSIREGKKCHGAIFTVKDTSVMTPPMLTKIMNGPYDIITCEIFYGMSEKQAMATYKSQIEVVKEANEEGWIEVGIAKKMRLDRFINNPDLRPYRHYAGFMLISRTTGGLSSAMEEFNKKAAEAGLQMGKEDMGTERSLYSFLPGNFRFVKHHVVVDKQEVGQFAYSYLFDNDNIESYIDKKPLFLLPTLQSNTYAFGIPESGSNMLISGVDHRTKSIFANMIGIYSLMNHDLNWYSLDFGNTRDTLMRCSEGVNRIVDANPENANYKISLFGVAQNKEQKVEHISKCLRELIGSEADRSIHMESFKQTVEYLAGCSSIDDVHEYFDSTIKDGPFGEYTKNWFSKEGIFAQMMDVQTEEADYESLETITYAPVLTKIEREEDRNFLITGLLNCILEKIKNYEFSSFVTIDNPFVVSKSQECYKILKEIIDSSKSRGTVCVMLCDPTDLKAFTDGITNLKMEDMAESCQTQLHMYDNEVNDAYGKMYNLEQHELVAIKKLREMEFSGILKQTNLILPVKLDFLKVNVSILDILHDNATFRDRVKRCMEFMKTSDPEVWAKYFIDRSAKERQNGAPLDEEEFVEKNEIPVYQIESRNREEAIAREILESA